jgi:predicted ATPase
LLTSAEQALFRRLSVFVNDWQLSAAEQVYQAAGVLELDLLEGLSSLLDKSLVHPQLERSGEPRYRLLYVLREFGLEHLEAEHEGMATREAHAVHFLALAEEAEPHLRGVLAKTWLDRLDKEHDNLRAAITSWLERAEQTSHPEAAEHTMRLGSALHQFWWTRFHYREG